MSSGQIFQLRTWLMFAWLLGAFAGASIVLVSVARADVAPPEQPPGSNISPGAQTNVVMVSERVVIEVQPAGEAAIGVVVGDFNMRNAGEAEERMQVRFPLGDPGGRGNGFGEFPQVQAFGASASSTVLPIGYIETPNPQGADQPPVRWATFDVVFPPGADVPIRVTYNITSTGNPPSALFAYVMETGAGWRDAIGSAEVVVRLPYIATNENIFYGKTSPGALLAGNEVRWRWENVEPTDKSNIVVTMLTPQSWQRVMQARMAAIERPDDTGALVALVEAYEGAITSRFPMAEGDTFAILSEETMSRAVSLQPGRADLHARYARLIWDHMVIQAQLPPDDPDLKRVLSEMYAALQIEPENAEAKALLAEIGPEMAGTPVPPTATPQPTQVPTLIPIEVPTRNLATAIATGTVPTAQRTTLAPITPSLIVPSPTTRASVPATPPAAGGSDNSLPLIIGLLGLPLALGIVGFALLSGRRKPEETEIN